VDDWQYRTITNNMILIEQEFFYRKKSIVNWFAIIEKCV
jgi:hypothetical protein